MQNSESCVKTRQISYTKDRRPVLKLSGGLTFTKIDLSQAYQQISLDEESQKYVVINTHKGLFKYTRLPFRISPAPSIYQRVMESVLQEFLG